MSDPVDPLLHEVGNRASWRRAIVGAGHKHRPRSKLTSSVHQIVRLTPANLVSTWRWCWYQSPTSTPFLPESTRNTSFATCAGHRLSRILQAIPCDPCGSDLERTTCYADYLA